MRVQIAPGVYSNELAKLDQEDFERSKNQREELYKIDREDLLRRTEEARELHKLQLELQTEQRRHTAEQLKFQEASLGIQAAAAAEQKKYNDDMRKLAQEQERVNRAPQQQDDFFLPPEPTDEEIKRLEDELLERPGYAQAKMKREILQEAFRLADRISDKKLEQLKAEARKNAEQRRPAEAPQRESDTVGAYFRETHKDLVPLEAVG